MPLFNKVTGRPLIVDELDEPVLNLGSGDQALNLHENFAGPRGPVINVDIAQQPTLQNTGRSIDPQNPPIHGVFPETPTPQHPIHMQGDATNLEQLSSLSPTGRFREIHAVNPYGFQPHNTAPLLNQTGVMHITGQDSNTYAQETPTQLLYRGRRGQPSVTQSEPRMEGFSYSSTQRGSMRAEHASLNHNLTSGRALDTTRSSTHTLRKKGG